ncbi:MAG TPA: GvpL/GvpF family gas vesicle protein [Thermoanaerobaculia bacterium]
MATVLYVYAIAREPVTPDADGIDDTRRFGTASIDGVAAVFTAMPADELSQEVIDRRANDLEWLGAIGYRHQAVVSDLMKKTAIVPLRAFTLFSGEEALRAYLGEHRDALRAALDRLDGKQEWTLRVEFDAARWSEALTARIASLRELQEQIASAPPGKAFLLRKKLDDEKKRASHDAEQSVLAEIESAVRDRLRCQTLSETRERRDGAFPQINVLLNRDEEDRLQEAAQDLAGRYEPEGITLAVTGPWPPYTFATMNDEG